MKALKEEGVDGQVYRDRDDARTRIGEFVEVALRSALPKGNSCYL
jgi:hypothetical protein